MCEVIEATFCTENFVNITFCRIFYHINADSHNRNVCQLITVDQ